MATYQEVKAMRESAEQPGFFGSILQGVTRPFRRLAESAKMGIAGLQVGADGDLFTKYKAFEGSTPEDIQSAIYDSDLNAVKGVATLGSFLVPGAIGTGLGGAVKAGAAGGALGGFGASEEDLLGSLADAGRGAAFGGVAGGALYGAGKAVGKVSDKLASGRLSQKADDITEDIIRGDVTVSKNRTIGRVNKRAKDARRAMERMGVKTSDVETMALQADELTSRLAQQKQALLRQANYEMAGNDLLEALGNTKAFRDNPSLIKNKALEPYFEMLQTRAGQRGGTVGADDLYAVIKQIDDDLYAISSGQVAPKSTAANKSLKALRDALSKKTKEVPGVADIDKTIAPIQRWLETDSAYAIRRQSGSQPIVQSSLPGSQALGIGKLANRAKAATAGAMRGVEGVAQGGATGATNLLDALSRQTGRIGAIGGVMSASQPSQATESPMPGMTEMGIDPLMQLSQPDPEQLTAQMTLELMMQGLDLRDAAQLAELTVMAQYGSGGGSGEGGAKMTEAEALYSNAAKAAERAYATLQGNPDVAGRAAGVSNFFSGITNTATPKTEYAAQIEAMGSFIRRAFLGSGQTDTELAKLEPFIPKVTDSPERAAQKFEQIIPLLQSYGQAGY